MTLLRTGPIALVRPDWGLEKGTTTSVVADGDDGRPEVLIAQMLCGATAGGARAVMLTARGLDDDPVWAALRDLLAGEDAHDGRRVAEILSRIPLTAYRWGAGWDLLGGAQLVYAAGLSARDMRRLRAVATAPVVTSATGSVDEVIRVGEGVIAVERAGFRVPVAYDPGGPMYRPVQ